MNNHIVYLMAALLGIGLFLFTGFRLNRRQEQNYLEKQ